MISTMLLFPSPTSVFFLVFVNFSFSIDLNLHVIQSSNFSTSYSHSTLIEHLIPCAWLPSPHQMYPQAPQHNRFQAELTISHAHFMPRPSPHYSRKALTHIVPFAQTENLGIIPGCSFSLILHQWLTSTCEWGRASLVAQMVKNPPAIRETWVLPLGREDPLEEGMTTHSSILVWRIPWTEEPGGLQSMGHKESETTEQLGTAQWVRRASKSFHPCLSPSPSSGPPHLSSKLWDHLITVSLSLFFFISGPHCEVKWSESRSVVSDSLWNSMKFSRPEYWNGLPFSSPGDLPNPGIKPRSPTLQVDSLPSEPPGKPKNTGVNEPIPSPADLPNPMTTAYIQASIRIFAALRISLLSHLSIFWFCTHELSSTL